MEKQKFKYTLHAKYDRSEREKFIEENIGFGEFRDEFEVDNNHPNGTEIHKVTSTALIFVFNKRTQRLITMFVASPNRIQRLYLTAKKKAPQDIIDKAIENREKGFYQKARDLH